MSEHKGPRPVAWEGWHATITGEKPLGALPGFVDVQEYEADEPGRDYSMTPAEAEKHAHALIMAAAVARGEQGHTAALNRAAQALGAGALAEASQEAARLRVELRDALHMAGDAPWGLLVDTAGRLRTELAEAREALAGKTMHDAAADVVAPLREALRVGDLDPSTLSPAGVVSHTLFRLGLREGARPARIATCGGRAERPAREPMTHHSLASIERHGVVVGDRLEWVSWAAAISLCKAVLLRGGLTVETQGGHRWPNVAVNSDALWPLTVVEAPDAD